jgi:outer membrane protein TolC
MTVVAAVVACAGLGCGQRYTAGTPDAAPLHIIDWFDPEGMVAVESTETVAAAAPEEMALTLAECRAGALRGNLGLNVTLIDPLIAREALIQQQAVYEPFFFTSATHRKTDSPVLIAPGDPLLRPFLLSSKAETLSGEAGVEFPLRTGGTLSLSLPAGRSKVDGADPRLDPAYDAGLDVSLSQPLLRGAGVGVNTYLIRIAELSEMQTASRTKLEVMRVLASVDRAYWALFSARRQLAVRANERGLAVAQLERARRMVQAGSMSEVEIIRAETGVAERDEAVIVAANTVRDRERELKTALQMEGLDVASPTGIIPATEARPEQYAFDRDKLIAAALANRMELLELEYQIAQDALTIDLQENATLPALALGYTYGIAGIGSDFGDAVDLAADKRFEGHTVSLSMTVPLGNRAARSALREAMLSKTRTLATRESRIASIRQEVLGAADAVETAWQRVVANRQRAVLAQRTLDAEVRQYGLGLRTSTEVLEAQARLADAQSAEINSVTQYQISLVDLAFATGTLSGEADVEWQPRIPPTAMVQE